MRYGLSINRKMIGSYASLKQVWQKIDQHYETSADQAKSSRWHVIDFSENVKAGASMPAPIWLACCEEPTSFRLYLECIVGWDPVESAMPDAA